MVMSETGKMKRDGVSVSVQVLHEDDYDDVIKKGAQTLQLSSISNLRLFKLRGALIPRSDDWCIGKYKRSLHYAPEAVELGVVYLRSTLDPTDVRLVHLHLPEQVYVITMFATESVNVTAGCWYIQAM